MDCLKTKHVVNNRFSGKVTAVKVPLLGGGLCDLTKVQVVVMVVVVVVVDECCFGGIG